ncbi:MAG: IS66 family transposase [Acidobacteriaceae bacterium]|nr:IS66 family transposase [Acidobacteriaceae bacterium]
MTMKRIRPRLEINLQELDQVLDQARQAPLSEPDCQKIRNTLHTLVELLAPARSTEKTNAVLANAADPANDPQTPANDRKASPQGHGRNGAAGFSAAQKVAVAHASLASGDRCPECEKGKVYRQKEPKPLLRIIGQAPLTATVYELERLRCNACGQIFTAQEPVEAGPDKYDATTGAMIAQLKYGSGVPFYRLEKLQSSLGIPLPAATQWEIVEEAAELLKPALEELIRQAAQGDVLHNDDTSMRILRLAREPSDKRTGTFTSGIVATRQGQKIALYFTGRQHAGENLAGVLRARAAELPPPLQMCDALSRNVPKLPAGVEILVAHCLAHGRRQFVDIVENFPAACRYVLEMLGKVYGFEAAARERGLPAPESLQFHQQYSAPVMAELHGWLERQLAEKQAEPNSGLGQAITYLLRHWRGLTAFLREANAPLDNNLCERALKRAVLHRKLFFKTMNGAQAGDLFMSLIHICELCGAHSFEYLTELQKHAAELARKPAQWMPWNYRDTVRAG